MALQRQSYYEVDPTAFIFAVGPRDPHGRAQPEEAVRQWCLYELIRAYGISISDLRIEAPVAVGSKQYRIDILVVREEVPWIVVECKPRTKAGLGAPMEQAVSYADSQGIKAEYAVATNGTDWRVKRRMEGDWVGVPDLPRAHQAGEETRLYAILSGLEKVGPVLYALMGDFEGLPARHLLGAVQQFFHGENVFTLHCSKKLIMATDVLARAIWAGTENPDYRASKLAAAWRQFGEYCDAVTPGITRTEPDPEVPFGRALFQLKTLLLAILEGSRGLTGPDVLLLRVDVALLNYGLLQDREPPYPRILPSLQMALREFLSPALTIALNAPLPPHGDQSSFEEIRGFFAEAWRRFELGEKGTDTW